MKKLKGTRGITLIALVVTIVVLLILATVSISMLGGENGIITQAQNAKLESRAGEVEERVNLWKSEKISSKYTNATVKTEDKLLEEMKIDKILFEDEIDRENKLITIGTREISYKLDDSLKNAFFLYPVESQITFKEGMTWQEFENSEYNTIHVDFYNDGTSIQIGNIQGTFRMNDNDRTKVKITDKIIEGMSYYISIE